MKNPISDAAASRRIAVLAAAVLAFDAPIVAAKLELARLESSADTLRSRIENEWAAAALPLPDATPNLGSALSDDPSAAIDGALIEAATRARTDADVEREQAKARAGMLTAALAEVPGQIAAARDEVYRLQDQRAAAERDMQDAAYQALVTEFRKRFVVVRDEVLTPLLSIVPRYAAAATFLSRDSVVQLRTYGAGGTSGFSVEQLLSLDDRAQADARATADEVFAAFLASIPPA